MKYTVTIVFIMLIACSDQGTPSISVDGVKPSLSLDQEKAWRTMTGTWYGSQPKKGGGQHDWIVVRDNTGAYQITFRSYDKNGDYEDSIEVGEWGISGPIYFSIFKARVKDGEFISVDPTNPYNRDTYKIISLSETEFIYESFTSDNRFTLKRVEDDFTFTQINDLN